MKLAKNKYCIFCGKEATTLDHIPTKSLLEKPYPNNLLTLGSCEKCNKSFSLDEEYLLNVLVEITYNPVLIKKKVSGNIYRARQRSPGLRERIEQSFVSDKAGRVYFNPEMNRIKKVMEKNALGLYYEKYNLLFKLNRFKCTGFFPYDIDESRPASIFMLTYKSNFQPKKWITVQGGVFSYIVVRDWTRNNKFSMIFNVHNTVWVVIEIPNPIHHQRNKNVYSQQLNLFKDFM